MTRKFLTLLPLAGMLAACGDNAEQSFRVQTAPVERRTIVVQAEASGVIEPMNVVEVKSRASGQIIEMPVETGTLVRPGDLIVQLDTRDVQNSWDQAKADLDAAEKRLEVSTIQKNRSDELLAAKIITPQENEAAQLDYSSAVTAIVRSRAALDIAQQRLDDARVTAPVTGTVIGKPVALGQVIQSGTSTAGGGTTIVTMADLTKVRARALVNETDIGQVKAGQEATVIVDAFPDRPFRGVVEKIEPQAVVQQNVTMFPVLVSIENREGLLLPGMNGEVAIVSQRRDNVIAVPNEAIRSVREAAATAEALGLDPDSVQAQIRSAMGGMGGFGRGNGGNGGNRPVQVTSPGFVDLAGSASATTADAQDAGRRQGARRPGGQLPNVTAEQCKAIEDARKAKPAAAKKVDDLQERMRADGADRQALMADLRKAYTELGADMNVVRACRANGGANGGTAAANGAAGPATPGVATRTGLVFVQTADSSWQAKVVRLGVADYDYTEVVSGLEGGENVALLSALALQLQREESQQRIRDRTSGSSPLGGGAGGGGRR
ncbi:MAG TPA: efflux RND transporter periplasmic adaptor subunit [Gemmatimonadaceae bacterium]|nr:efflux RND transporter periplasmic adaptor subunit [Gemmatimonadaceae bacterium]